MGPDLDNSMSAARTSATYLYGLVRSQGPLRTEGAPPGLPGLSAIRALAVGDGLWLVAADAPLPEYEADSIQSHLQDLSWVSDRALAHEAVVEHFSELAGPGMVVPMKLFTLFDSDDRALQHIRAERGRLDRILERIAGCQEWGVRIRFDEERARELAKEEVQRQAGKHGAGTTFLLRKKVEKDTSRSQLEDVRTSAEEVFSDLSARAEGARRRDPLSPLVLDGAFLVLAGRSSDFEKEVHRWAGRLSELACELTLTGPWPPYNFIGEEAS